jgi:hypothetical protein
MDFSNIGEYDDNTIDLTDIFPSLNDDSQNEINEINKKIDTLCEKINEINRKIDILIEINETKKSE